MFTYKLSSRTTVSINILKNIFLSQSRESNPIHLPTVWTAMLLKIIIWGAGLSPAPQWINLSHG